MERKPPRSLEPDVDPASILFLRIGIVVRLTGLPRSTIYRMMAEQRFPAPVRLAKRIVAWRRADLERWSEKLTQSTH